MGPTYILQLCMGPSYLWGSLTNPAPSPFIIRTLQMGVSTDQWLWFPTKRNHGYFRFHFQFLSSSKGSCNHEVPDSLCTDVKGDDIWQSRSQPPTASQPELLYCPEGTCTLYNKQQESQRTNSFRNTPNKRRVMIIRRLMSQRSLLPSWNLRELRK